MENKTTRPADSLINFSSSADIIKKTAKSIDTQLREVASEIAEDLKENSSNLATKTMAPVKKAITNAIDNVNLVEAAEKANNYTLKTAEEILEGVVENSEKWQNVAEKAISGGLKMAATQQDMVFGTLEAFKNQFTHTSKRLKKLVYNVKPAKAIKEDK